MTTARDRILDAAEELISEGHVPPSLDAVAARAGVSKGGLLYHFSSRSLLSGLVVRAVETADAIFTDAAARGRLATTWVRLSAGDDRQQRVYRGMLTMLRVTARGDLDLPTEVERTSRRWHQLLAAELGDPRLATTVRLVGDGLLLAALTGTPTSPAELDDVLAHLGLGDAASTVEPPVDPRRPSP